MTISVEIKNAGSAPGVSLCVTVNDQEKHLKNGEAHSFTLTRDDEVTLSEHDELPR
jgi:hypothetical protein